MTATTVTLNGLALDCTSVDADGISYGWEALDGWFDTTDLRAEVAEIQPMGGAQSVARRNARQLSLTLFANLPATNRPLGDLYYTAVRSVKRALDLAAAPALLSVAEPGLTLQAYVRAAGPIRSKMIGARSIASFLVPLVAPDPRRYAAIATTDTSSLTLTGSAANVNHSFVNAGDLPTPGLFTLSGPGVNPHVRNDSLAALPIVAYLGTLGGGDSLVIDMANLTAELNGVSVIGDMRGTAGGPPEWWQLQPGTNSVRFHRSSGSGTATAQITYRDAYS